MAPTGDRLLKLSLVARAAFAIVWFQWKTLELNSELGVSDRQKPFVLPIEDLQPLGVLAIRARRIRRLVCGARVLEARGATLPTRRLIDIETHEAVFTWVLQRLADRWSLIARK